MRWPASLFAAFALACAPPSMLPRAPGAPDAVAVRGRGEIGCSTATTVDLAPGHVAIVGCGAQREYRRMCNGGGCSWIAIDDLAIRAGFELDCPTSAIEIVTLGTSSRGVIGCGTRATYVLVCSSEGCHWLPSSMRRAHLAERASRSARLDEAETRAVSIARDE